MIRVLVADDQNLVRGALVALISLAADIEVVAEAANGLAAVDAAATTLPDVVLIDIEMPGLDGIAASERIRAAAPAARVIILTTFGRPGYLRRAMDAGARGFVVKDAWADELVDVIRRVHNGQTVLDPKLAVASLTSGPNPLTSREQDVLRAAADGASAAEVAQRLRLSEGTVRNYLSAAIGKCLARNRMGAVQVARDNGWL